MEQQAGRVKGLDMIAGKNKQNNKLLFKHPKIRLRRGSKDQHLQSNLEQLGQFNGVEETNKSTADKSKE